MNKIQAVADAVAKLKDDCETFKGRVDSADSLRADGHWDEMKKELDKAKSEYDKAKSAYESNKSEGPKAKMNFWKEKYELYKNAYKGKSEERNFFKKK